MKELLFRCLDTIATGTSPLGKSKTGKEICNTNSFCSQILPKTVKLVRLRDLGIHEDYQNTLNFDFEKEKTEKYKDVLLTDRSGLLICRRKDDDLGIYPLCVYEEDNTVFNWNRPIPKDINLFYLLREPDEGFGEGFCYLKESETFRKKFKAIFTHNKNLLDLNYDNVYFYPWGTTLLDNEDQFKIYNKTKLVSFHYSYKTWWEGHAFRTNIGNFLKKQNLSNIDIEGPLEYVDYVDKIDTVKDYHYSIEIENVFEDLFFSDKIIDCFLTGTIPIYKGCKQISKFFNTDGIIFFDNEAELLDILKNLTPEQYKSKEKAIIENFEKAKEYIHPEDYIFKNYKHLFENDC